MKISRPYQQPNAFHSRVQAGAFYVHIPTLSTAAAPRIRDFRGFPGNSFDGNGNYSFWTQTAGEWDFIAEGSGPSDAFNPAGEGNHIRVDCVGDTISLYVNEQFVDSISGLDIPRGDVGLIAETNVDDLIEVEFDNFVVYEP